MPSASQDRKAAQLAAYEAAAAPNSYLQRHDLRAWGADCSTKQIDLACLDGSATPTPDFFSAPVEAGPRQNAGIRLSQAWAAAHHLATLLSWSHTPGIVAIELPYGTGAAKQLPFVGAYAAGITAALAATLGNVPPVIFIQPNEWKAAVGLPGNANKAAITRRWIEVHDLDTTLETEDDESTQDQRDAFFVALAGRKLI